MRATGGQVGNDRWTCDALVDQIFYWINKIMIHETRQETPGQ